MFDPTSLGLSSGVESVDKVTFTITSKPDGLPLYEFTCHVGDTFELSGEKMCIKAIYSGGGTRPALAASMANGDNLIMGVSDLASQVYIGLSRFVAPAEAPDRRA